MTAEAGCSGPLSDAEFEALIAEMGPIKEGVDRAEARRAIGDLIAQLKRGDPREAQRRKRRAAAKTVLKHSAALASALESAPTISAELDAGASCDIPPSAQLRSILFQIDRIAEQESADPHRSHSIYKVMSWTDHLIGCTMKAVFEAHFGRPGRSESGPFPRFVNWIFVKAQKPKRSGGAIKNALDIGAYFSGTEKPTAAIERRIRKRLAEIK